MRYSAIWHLICVALALALAGQAGAALGADSSGSVERLVLDDFSSEALNPVFGSRWLVPDIWTPGMAPAGEIEFVEHEGRWSLHLVGAEASKDAAGVIQVRLGVSRRRRYFDAGAFDGIELTVKGNGSRYAVNLTTADTRQSRQLYQAGFQTNRSWQQVTIPFGRFLPSYLKAPLNDSKITGVTIAAIDKQSPADIYIDKIAFYKDKTMYKKLTPEEERVIIHKGTESPFSGEYDKHYEKGIYSCRRCGAELYESTSKFKSGCGWPSFDDEIDNAVKRTRDADGVRTEITCAKCNAHLGHVFLGEGMTRKNVRHCVNSISLDFTPERAKTERAIFASGCFWGTEYYLKKAPGVISTTVGYTGGKVNNPTYEQVCTDKTGHAEAVEVVYDPRKTSYEQLAKLFFETHDFTQLNRQGPDIGRQYRSEIFYLNDEQAEIVKGLIAELRQKKFDVKTRLSPGSKFWPAEGYHQDYYDKTAKTPYCHIYRKIF